MKAGSIPAGGFPATTPEEELKTLVGRAFFRRWEWGRILGKIDFCVGMPARHAGDEFVSLLWAEAKKGHADLREALVQLVLTIGRAHTFDRHLPPQLLAAFDCARIAFVPYTAVQAVFQQSDFNWRVAPSDHSTREFRQLDGLIGAVLGREATVFHFAQDETPLREFIWQNLRGYAGGVARIEIDKNNFIAVYNRWLEAVKPSIGVDWEEMRGSGVIDGDFYLADLLSEEAEDSGRDAARHVATPRYRTLREKLFVLLHDDRYVLNRRVNAAGLYDESLAFFRDGQLAHTQFWNRYVRPPLQEYWDFLVARRDLLVPQDIRERKGSFFTPQQWVELSQRYLAEVLGEDWQEEYTVWDPAAGTGNLLNGLTNKYNIWASTLDQQDVDVMRDRIRNGANLLESHVFQFDFLNDGFEKLPAELRAIVEDPERRRKLVVYMNPPYAEGDAKVGRGRMGVQVSRIHDKYQSLMGRASAELSAQFLARCYAELSGCYIGEFSPLKVHVVPNFSKFRTFFKAHIDRLFLVPAYTFDNVKGQFPISFTVWNTSIDSPIGDTQADIFNEEGHRTGKRTIANPDGRKLISNWLAEYSPTKRSNPIGRMTSVGNDFQHNDPFIESSATPRMNGGRCTPISVGNLLVVAVFFAVRLCVAHSWINHRDQFLAPKLQWMQDPTFRSDCLAFTLFHPKNRISATTGTNHWIPYTEYEVDAKEKFSSHFMADFLSGRLGREKAEAGDLFAENLDLIPKEPVVFSSEAQAVLDAGRDLWRYYHAQPNANPNAALYDIRLHFQGCKPNGHMNPKSDDPRYTELISSLRERLKALARKIEPKVYEHGFLLG